MKHYQLILATAAIAISAPGAALAKSHGEGHDGHNMEKMEDGTMQCCMTDKDGKKVCHMMDHDEMDHDKMDHSKMDHSKMGHGTMDHSKMDHSKMGHGNMEKADTAAEEPN